MWTLTGRTQRHHNCAQFLALVWKVHGLDLDISWHQNYLSQIRGAASCTAWRPYSGLNQEPCCLLDFHVAYWFLSAEALQRETVVGMISSATLRMKPHAKATLCWLVSLYWWWSQFHEMCFGLANSQLQVWHLKCPTWHTSWTFRRPCQCSSACEVPSLSRSAANKNPAVLHINL